MENTPDDSEKHIPSLFQSSCPGNIAEEEHSGQELTAARPEQGQGLGLFDDATFQQQQDEQDEAVETSTKEKEGWTRSLRSMPSFSNEQLIKKLIKASETMPKNGQAPKPYRNKKHGYKLWKEGYVRAVFVKPNVQGKILLFLVKARVCASMKSIQYDVYVHLDQSNGEVFYAKCNCKAGQGGCCKHVAALLYTLVDFSIMDLNEIPRDLTCTQVGQNWHIPADPRSSSRKTLKFNELAFEKAEEGKKRKRPLLTAERENYCGTPPFAWKTEPEELSGLVQKLRLAGKSGLFCDALELNQFQPCNLYDTSCSKAVKQKTCDRAEQEAFEEQAQYMSKIYDNVTKTVISRESFIGEENIRSAVYAKLGVSVEESIEICRKTIKQSDEPIWYLERSKRITASVFGKILNRRQTIHPASLVSTITEKAIVPKRSMPTAMKWAPLLNSDIDFEFLICHRVSSTCGENKRVRISKSV